MKTLRPLILALLAVSALLTISASAQNVTAPIVNATTGFEYNGAALFEYLLTGNGSYFTSAAPGLLNSFNSPVTTTPYGVLCTNSAGVVDSASVLEFSAAAGTSAAQVNLPSAAANTGCVVALLVDGTSQGITLTAVSGELINVWTGGAYLGSQQSYTLSNGQFATINAGGYKGQSYGFWSLRVSPPTATPFATGSSSVYVTRVDGGNFSCTSSTCSATYPYAPEVISGTAHTLAITIPPSPAVNLSFSCDLSVGVQDTSSPMVVFFIWDFNPANPNASSLISGTAMATMGTSATSVYNGVLNTFKVTTAPRWIVGAPITDTTTHHVHLAGSVEQSASTATNVVQIMIGTTSSLGVTVYRNSFCQWQQDAY